MLPFYELNGFTIFNKVSVFAVKLSGEISNSFLLFYKIVEF